jgi:hypothetical protein
LLDARQIADPISIGVADAGRCSRNVGFVT